MLGEKTHSSVSPQSAVGYDKPWTHHWLGLHLCGVMQMMTNSFIPHHVCVANRCNTLGWVLLGTWLRGWAAWLNHSEESCYQSAVKPLSQPSLLARAFVHLYSDVALTSLLGYMCDDGSTLFQFVTRWMCQCHLHMSTSDRGLCFWCFWLEDNLMEDVTCPQTQNIHYSHNTKCLLCQPIRNIYNKLYVHINIGRFILDMFIVK